MAGGFGSRLEEETASRPKPMVEIGGRPILWHIMKHYAYYGHKEFIVALGYKGEMVKRYFLDYYGLSGDMTIQLSNGHAEFHPQEREDWTVHLVETGISTNTGGRIRRLRPHLAGGTFMLTYGDGLSDVDLLELVKFHRSHGKLATVTAVRPPSRFGGLVFDGDLVCEFIEKPQIGEGWVNGGFMILEPGMLDWLDGDDSSLEADALDRLAACRQLAAYRHQAFWQCMDTLREVRLLESLWRSGRAPWKVWE